MIRRHPGRPACRASLLSPVYQPNVPLWKMVFWLISSRNSGVGRDPGGVDSSRLRTSPSYARGRQNRRGVMEFDERFRTNVEDTRVRGLKPTSTFMLSLRDARMPGRAATIDGRRGLQSTV